MIDATAQSFGIRSVAVADRGTGESGLDEEACRLLGVGPDVNQDELRHTYRQLASQMHPDTGVALEMYQQDELAGAFVRIREAYERLLVQIEARDRRGI
jgi:DnaJ-domain-containing protein 1